MRWCVALLLLCVPWIGTACAQEKTWDKMNAIERLQSDSLLRATVLEIAHMPPDELETFARTLAACNVSALASDDADQHVCARQYEYFDYSSGLRSPALSLLFNAMWLHWTSLRSSAKASRPAADWANKNLVRIVDIKMRWRSALKRRFAGLPVTTE